MTQIMKFAIDKAFFDKKNVIALIEALPEYMQEDAFLIAVGDYKMPECAKIGSKGIKNDKIYIVDDVKPFDGIHITNIENETDTLRVPVSVWRLYSNEYKKYIKEQQEEYLRKEEELRKEYQQKIK